MRYRVRRGLFGKAILQRWACFPEGISSALAGQCNWIDVHYNNAPAELIAKNATQQQPQSKE